MCEAGLDRFEARATNALASGLPLKSQFASAVAIFNHSRPLPAKSARSTTTRLLGERNKARVLRAGCAG
jgi:hypothetical protein